MVHAYRAFEFARHEQGNVRSPFWRAYREYRHHLGDESYGFETSVLWTNLFRMSLDGGSVLAGRADEWHQVLEASKDLLRREIEILRPTAIVFHTGPRYERALKDTFPSLSIQTFKDYDVTRTARLEHPSLPTHAWRTYHPGYLNRGRRWQILKDILTAMPSASN